MRELIRILVASALLCTCAMALGAPVDEALVARFEAAGTPAEQQQIAVEIYKRLDDGPMAAGLDERLISVLVSRPSLGHSRYTIVLEKMGSQYPFSATSINAIATGLVTDSISHDWQAYQTLREILQAYQQADGLPDPAYASLRQSLKSQRPYWMVIEVLATIDADDPRHDDAFSAIVAALEEHEHYGIRSAAIAGIARMRDGRALPEAALAALQKAALTDEYISVRLEAMDLLSTPALAEDRKQLIGASLAQELATPTPGLWQRAPSTYSRGDLYLLSLDVLTRLYAMPYPDNVIDALIVQTRSSAAERCVELLRANRPPEGYSAAQRRKLEAMAVQHYSEDVRAALFQLVAPQLDAGALQGTLTAFKNDQDYPAQIAAGYALLNHYRAGEVPGPVIEVASRIVRESKNGQLQHLAASLIARGDEPFAGREQRLLAGLLAHPLGGNFYDAFIELYGDDRINDMVIRYAADSAVPVWFRSQVILSLGQRAAPNASLPAPVVDAVLAAAKISSEYRIVGAVISTLEAWHIKVPTRVRLQAKETHSTALFVGLIICALTNTIICLLVFIRVLVSPLRDDVTATRRTLIALGWLLLSFGMSLVLAFGLLGFIGHNAAPHPRATLQFQIPTYVGTVVYLAIARFIFSWAKGRSR